jgi:hypothetical protein
MKSFNQFLNESYFSEEIPTGMSRDEFNRLPSKSKSKLTGSKLGIGNKGQTLNTSQNAPAVRRARNLNTPVSSGNSGKMPIPNPPKPPASTPPTGGKPPASTPPTGGKPPASTPPTGGKPPTSTPPSGASSAAKTVTKATGKGILKGLGRVVGPASAALDVADERSKGSGWLRSLAKGATVAAGGALGGAAGTAAGPVGTVVGAGAGSMAASKAFDVVAGKNARERAADRVANRQRQAGSAVKGIGGSTSFSQKKPGGPAFMSTGVGKQRKTVQLARTGVVQRGGQSVAGNLAFKNGQAVYKAPRAAGSDDGFIGQIARKIAPGAFKKSDAAAAARNLATARSNDAARNKTLGVKKLPAK